MLIFFYSGLMCYYALICRNTRVWGNCTSGVKTLFCLKKGSPLFKLLYGKSCQQTDNKGVNLCFCGLYSYTVPGGKVQFSPSNWSGNSAASYGSRNSVNLANKDLLISQREQFPAFSWSEDYFLVWERLSTTKSPSLKLNCTWLTKGENKSINDPVWGHLTRRKRNTMPILTAQNYWE